MDIWETVATERLRLADELEALTDEQWSTQSRCDAWTVSELAAHLVLPFEVSKPKFGLAMLRNRGNLDKAMIQLTAKIHAKFSNDEVIAKLRTNAESQWTPPKLGPEIPLCEVLVHGQDIRRALGLAQTVPDETIDFALAKIDDEALHRDYAGRIGV